MTWTLSCPEMLLGLLLALLIASAPVHGEDHGDGEVNEMDKRHVGSMAREGLLPFQGKRYVASLARNGELPPYSRRQWSKRFHPMTFGRNYQGFHSNDEMGSSKRYMGSLAKSGNIPFGKRDFDLSKIEKILEKILSTEDLWKRQVKELKLELLKGELENMAKNSDYDDIDEISKRSLASLVRNGNLPFRDEAKRSVEALARGGYLPAPKVPDSAEDIEVDNSQENSSLGKRGISSLAKSGQLQHGNFRFLNDDKRGGISSLAKNGYLQLKRDEGNDDDGIKELEKLLEELGDLDEAVDKRHIGSFARSFGVPRPGKRNIGSLARDGGFSSLRYAPTKKNDNDDDEDSGEDSDEDQDDDDKRSIGSFMRGRQIGKRYVGSLLRGRRYPFDYVSKKDVSQQDEMEDVAKRYIASLLRQGRGSADYDDNYEPNAEEEKRHLGSFMSTKNRIQVHKKSVRSIGTDESSYRMNESEPQTTTDNSLAAASKSKRSVKDSFDHRQKEENQIPATTENTVFRKALHSGEDGEAKRSKRQVYISPDSEYPIPVVQNSALFDYDDEGDVLEDDLSADKRFLGRIPQWSRIGHKNSSNNPTGRRRQPSRI